LSPTGQHVAGATKYWLLLHAAVGPRFGTFGTNGLFTILNGLCTIRPICPIAGLASPTKVDNITHIIPKQPNLFILEALPTTSNK